MTERLIFSGIVIECFSDCFGSKFGNFCSIKRKPYCMYAVIKSPIHRKSCGVPLAGAVNIAYNRRKGSGDYGVYS